MAEEQNEKNEAVEYEKDAEQNVISEDVIAVIAGVAATEVEGVADMSAGFAGSIVEALGRKNPSKGVKVKVEGTEAELDMYIIVKYGYRIPEVAWNVQEKVKETVESLASVFVTAVNIHVQGVDFSEYKEKENESENGGEEKKKLQEEKAEGGQEE